MWSRSQSIFMFQPEPQETFFIPLPPHFSSDLLSLAKYSPTCFPSLPSFPPLVVKPRVLLCGWLKSLLSALVCPPVSVVPAHPSAHDISLLGTHQSLRTAPGMTVGPSPSPEGPTQSGILPLTESSALASRTPFLLLLLSGMCFSPPLPSSSLYPRSCSK